MTDSQGNSSDSSGADAKKNGSSSKKDKDQSPKTKLVFPVNYNGKVQSSVDHKES